jgi:hypothetical protein
VDGFASSSEDGKAEFCYTGTKPGRDTIKGTVSDKNATTEIVWTTHEAVVANAGPDQILECPARATLAGSTSADPSGLEFGWSIDGLSVGTTQIAHVSLPLGQHQGTLVVSSGANSARDDLSIAVVDRVAPEPECPVVSELALDARCAAEITVTARAADACEGAVSQTHLFTFNGPGLQSHTFDFVDSSGNASQCATTVTAADSLAPSVLCNSSDVTASDGIVSFSALATDGCDANPHIQISAVRCLSSSGAEMATCAASAAGNLLSVDSGSSGARVEWLVTALDASGNSAAEVCALRISDAAPTNVCEWKPPPPRHHAPSRRHHGHRW